MAARSDEHGQVQSSLVAVAAVAAILAGLLVLFGTGGTDGKTADQPPSPKPTVLPATTADDTPTAQPSTPTPSSATPTPTQSTTPVAAQTSAPTIVPTAAKPTANGPRPRIEIYNNTTRRGLADQVAARARAAGWTVAGIDNWRGKVVTTTVYYPPGMKDHAADLAADLGIASIKAALSNMKTDRLTVILTTDYPG